MKYIEGGWEGYRKILYEEVPEERLGELRQAFETGAAFLFYTIMNVLDDGREPTEKDLLIVGEISAEMSEISAKLDCSLLPEGARH